MKKSILTLLVLFVCAVQPITAYEYFTIYFSDGTKSEAFYATDVDSICYSKISLDSIAYDDWQVQEIYTCDSVYRYSLAQIDSLSFKDVDVNKVAENIANVSEVITPLFIESSSPIKLSERKEEIQNIDGVEDVYINNQTLYIKIRDWGYISFYFPIDDSDKDDDELNLAPLSQNMKANMRRSNENEGHKYTEVLKACVVNQQYYDEKRKSFKDIANQFKVSFESIGVNADIENMPSLDFFKNSMFDYDILFIKTHGDYDEKTDLHWLCTGEELWSYNPNEISIGDIGKLLNVKLPLWLKHGYSPRKVSFMCIKEKRGGDFLHIYYTTISDEFISSAKRKFRNAGSAIVFNTACESMMGNNKMAKAFEERGAGCYLGYDDSNSVGGIAGKNLFAHLLVGKSTQSAYNAIPNWCKEQTIYEDEDGITYDAPPSGKKYNKYNPKLKEYPPSICITHPETLSAEEKPEGEIMSTVLKGCLKRANIPGAFGNTSVGFQYCTNSDMSQAKKIEAQGNYDSSTLYMNWEATLDENDLKPNTTYYYRAYMNDGYSNCYGEIKVISNKVPYAVLDSNTFSFYYDGKQNERNGKIFPINKENTKYGWDNEQVRNQTTKVVFDQSFAEFYPDRLDLWFGGFENLTTIENIKNLKTDSVTTMYLMFCGCSSIKKLDLSSFNTSKVRMMSRMFQACSSLQDLNIHNFTFPEYIEMLFDSCPELEKIDVGNANTEKVKNFSFLFHSLISLKNLDLSSFNTKQATNMSAMFGSCSSLVSLDISHFDTSNVTDMSAMFGSCSSLVSLNLSHFDTSNVTDMSYMFRGCSQLTDLDVSHFNTDKVTDMSSLFDGCGSLIKIDVSHFNTGNVTDMSSLFDGCVSLTKLDVSHFNTDNVTDMSSLFAGCSQLTDIDVSHFSTSNVTDMSAMFGGCNLLKELNISHFKTKKVTNMSAMFINCNSLKTLDVSRFNTDKVTDMSKMFALCTGLKNLDISNFNTSLVNNMAYMFWDCESLEELDLSSFDTSNVTDMSGMFSECELLKELDLSGFSTSNVTDMSRMFMYCRLLSSLDISHFDMSNVKKGYNFWNCESLRSLNMSNYYASESTDVNEMFRGCSSLETLDISNFYAPSAKDMGGMFALSTLKSINLTNFKTEGVKNMNGMFSGCSSLSNLDLSSFSTSNVTDMSHMFSGCTSLTKVGLSSFVTNKVTNMYGMFYDCKSLTSLDVSNFNVSNIKEDGLSYMFDGCKNMKRINMFTINAPKITSLNGFFRDCIALENLNLENINIPLCESISLFISSCESLKTLDMSNFNAPSATVFYGFIGYHPHLKELNLSNMTIPNAQIQDGSTASLGAYDSLTVADLSNFKVPDSCTKMNNFHLIRFNEAESLNISNFNTNNLTKLSVNSWFDGIFRGKVKKLNMSDFNAPHLIEFEESFDSLTYANLNNFIAPELEKIGLYGYVETFDTNDLYAPKLNSLKIPNCEVLNMNNCHIGVSDVEYLFSDAYGNDKQIKYIYLSGFSAPNLITTESMFSGNHHVQSIDISNFSCPNVTNMRRMFSGCNSLTSLDLSSLNTSNVTDMESMFSGCSSLTSLNLSGFDTSNVSSMKSMFSGCSSLKRLDLSSFNISNVFTYSMFCDCSSLKTIYANNWNCDGSQMFLRCEKLVGGKGTKIGYTIFYNEFNSPSSYYCPDDDSAAHIDGGKDNPGLFTAK